MCVKTRLALLSVALGALAGLAGCTVGVGAGSGRVRGWFWGHPGYSLAVIGSTDIQFIADVDDDVFFHLGIWYRWYGGAWYNCRTYGGTWVRIAEPPAVFLRIPPRHVKYRAVSAYAERQRAVPGPGPGKSPPPRRGPPGRGRGPGG